MYKTVSQERPGEVRVLLLAQRLEVFDERVHEGRGEEEPSPPTDALPDEACLLLVREDLLGFWQAVVSDWTDLCAVNCLDELRRIWTPPMWRLDYLVKLWTSDISNTTPCPETPCPERVATSCGVRCSLDLHTPQWTRDPRTLKPLRLLRVLQLEHSRRFTTILLFRDLWVHKSCVNP